MKTRLSRLIWSGVALGASSLLAACGGGSGGDDPTRPPTPTTLTGKLIDSAVSGVKFTSAPSGTTGTTGSAGEFLYVAGDTVQFAVGNVVLGSVSGQETVTPKVIADATVNLPAGVSSTDVAQNIAVFLQSFDADGNPDNGITISADVGAAAANVTLNFGQKPEDFGKDPSLNKLADDTGNTVVTPDEANAHQQNSLASQLAGTWVEEKSSSVAALTIFTDGTYVLAMKDDECDNGVEYGRFKIDANTGTISAQASSYVDTTASDCGLHHTDTATQYVGPFVINGDTLKLTREDGEHSLTRAPTSSGIVGSWLLNQPITAGSPIEGPAIVTFFGDGHYLLADALLVDGDSTDGDDHRSGLEYGTWTTAADGTLTSHAEIDTNGADVGLSSNLNPGTKLLINAGGLLELDEPGETALTFTRLPLVKTLDASDITGSWYFSDQDSGQLISISFFKDGRYVGGSQSPDPDCDHDYGTEFPDQSADGDLDPDGVGSEFGQWVLEQGLGRVFVSNLQVDSDGSCGLFDRNNNPGPWAAGGRNMSALFVKKIDADTLQATYYEHQDGGTDESNNGSYQPGTVEIKRVPSQANSLVGSWKVFNADDGLDELAYFFADGTLFEVDTDEKGGIGRAKWSLSEASLTMHYDGSDPNCVDTIGSNGDCADNGGAGRSYTFTLTLADDGKSATLTDASDDTGLTLRLEKID
jgi:hypothetical protein